MRSERLGIVNRRGARLAARCDLPDGEPTGTALFAHCFTCTMNLRAVGAIASALTDRGLAVLRFDFTGLGESEGEFAETNFTTNVEDLVDAAGALAPRHGAPSLLIGHSLGGAAVIRAATDIPSTRAVATIAAPSSPDHVVRHLRSHVDEIRESGSAEVLLAGRPFTITRRFLDDLERHDMARAIAGLDRPLLVMHAPADRVIGIDDGLEIFDAARQPKSFVALDGADHLMSDPPTAERVGAILAAWASPYVGGLDSDGGREP
jgi:putative redox protein